MIALDAAPDPFDVTLLVLPGSSMMSLASTLEPLRACNRVSRKPRIDWRLVTLDGAPAMLSCGLALPVQGRLEAQASGDLLVVIAGFDAVAEAGRGGIALIRALRSRFGALAGIEAGGWVLGAAGALEGRCATTHWEDLEDFTARHLGTEVRADRYVVDRGVLTAGGASPAFDLMLDLIRRRWGQATALDVASVFIYDEAHAPTDAQPLVSLGRLEAREPRVARAIRIMEGSLERPLTSAAIARRIGVSVRRLETLFREQMGRSPAGYYAELRLLAARRLVADTGLSMREIALRSGFTSLSAFSRSFRRHAGTSAREFRTAARARGMRGEI